ncbi:hypothetical protein K461DRAFT_275408 [Myriangium duriaei CBS 260.36]|uniref:Mso1 N-terminal domain-containing protein n=1 Tax=Myriangium duriaei CBS 260.36 TaxID=1168546 RepID=A0A9P4J904_9PEZI|nr:hypothetical protein K461DRAFT_275408 [Myriangium duriaei CBS 260.36]
MSSYLSSLLTSTTDKYTQLRRTLGTSETDGDTEDDSHITRVLRAYYTESPRPWPDWLPPDPRRPPAPVQPQYQPSTVGQGYGNFSSPSAGNIPQQGNRSALSDLWDAPSPSSRTAPPTSLRGPRQQPQQQPQQLSVPAARPLPSQRAGSYQQQAMRAQELVPQNTGGSGSSMGGGGTAQERLKARLWGQQGRGASPGPPPSGQGQGQGGYGGGGGRWG